jgi:hypothetical protein
MAYINIFIMCWHPLGIIWYDLVNMVDILRMMSHFFIEQMLVGWPFVNKIS